METSQTPVREKKKPLGEKSDGVEVGLRRSRTSTENSTTTQTSTRSGKEKIDLSNTRDLRQDYCFTRRTTSAKDKPPFPSPIPHKPKSQITILAEKTLRKTSQSGIRALI
jgi:LysM repeat protein